MTVNIPNWTSANLSDISLVVRGITFPASAKLNEWSIDRVCCLRTSNIQKKLDLRDVYFVDRSYVKREEQIVQPGDILMSMANSYELVGKVARADNLIYPSAFGAFLAAVRPTDVINGSYLFNFLKSSEAQRKLREGSSQTTNIANISASTLGKLEIPLPPLAEQRRIADKLDTTLARVDALNDRLARITPLLKRFRQSVLAAATSGRLTEDWQCTNSLTKPWISTEIQHVATVGTGSTPSRSNADFFASEGTPWITSSATGQALIKAADEYVTEAAINAHRLKIYPIGTLLVAMYGEGKTRGQVSELGIASTINQACAAIVVNEKKIDKNFLKLSLQANYLEMRVLAEGGNQPNLNLSKIKGFSVNLPLMEEQNEIVRRVETLFAFADRLEARLQSAQTAAERLTPALLAKAFRGELVPQDPNDEPATELLRRLRAARAADTASKPKRGRKTRTDN